MSRALPYYNDSFCHRLLVKSPSKIILLRSPILSLTKGLPLVLPSLIVNYEAKPRRGKKNGTVTVNYTGTFHFHPITFFRQPKLNNLLSTRSVTFKTVKTTRQPPVSRHSQSLLINSKETSQSVRYNLQCSRTENGTKGRLTMTIRLR